MAFSSSKQHELLAFRLKVRIRLALQGSQAEAMDACWVLNAVNAAWV